MGLSSKSFLVDGHGQLHILPGTVFMRMLRQEEVARLPDFAAQRVRCAGVVVQTTEGKPQQVVHRTFSILPIGPDGLLDTGRFGTQQMARMEAYVFAAVREARSRSKVVDAESTFIARGGTWDPDAALLQRIDAAALGRLRCSRVRAVP